MELLPQVAWRVSGECGARLTDSPDDERHKSDLDETKKRNDDLARWRSLYFGAPHIENREACLEGGGEGGPNGCDGAEGWRGRR